MTDHVEPRKRSEIMRAVRSKSTGPELVVRSAAHRMGLRFRLHRKDLPGSPDIVLPGKMTVIFVHGCYWHRHANCEKATTPKSNTAFWQEKFDRNVIRDKKNIADLRKLGWRVIVLWQCQVKSIESAQKLLHKKLTESGTDWRQTPTIQLKPSKHQKL